MLIRLGIKSDLNEVIELFKILDEKHIRNRNDFKKSIDFKRYTDILEKCFQEVDYVLIVAEAESKIIGFGIGRVYKVQNHSFLKDHKIGEILYLVVDAKKRRTGIGRNILEYLEIHLKLKESERIELRVYNFNEEAYPESVGYHKKFTIYEKLLNANSKSISTKN